MLKAQGMLIEFPGANIKEWSKIPFSERREAERAVVKS
jgi:hypothetical protein